jgi:lysozyme family protein
MQSVHDIAHEIVAREGGYVNDPDDPGGATNFGVTIHTMRRLGLDLDRDGTVTAADVRMLTRDQAVAIFLEHSYTRPLIAELPQPLRASVFDMYLNAGANAVKILQRLMVDMGYAVAVDGALGPVSIAAVRAAY